MANDDPGGAFCFNKLITGNFRIGVSQNTMVNALAKTSKLESPVIAHRISGNWDPVTTKFTDLLSEHAVAADNSKTLSILIWPMRSKTK
jgi:DNA ligase-1